MREKDVKFSNKKPELYIVISRFSARGAYYNFGYLEGGRFIETGRLLGTGHIFFNESAEYIKKHFDVYLKSIKKTGKRTCCPWISPG